MQINNAQLNSIGERIRAFALDKYGKINDFADALGMGAPNVQSYMRGARKPGSSVLQKIQRLGCNLDWLLTGEGEMYGSNEGKKDAGNAGIQKTDSTPVQGIKNDHLTPVKQTLNANAAASSIKTKPYLYEAIGRMLAVHDEDIKEGDILVIDPTISAEQGDLVLKGTPDGPELARYQPGEENTKGVVVGLTRQYPTIDRK
jgi:transcriptional regulator with XRE-family HTH domain